MAEYPIAGKASLRLLCVLIPTALLSSGCLTTSPRMHAFADSIQHELPEMELEHIRGGTFGRVSLGMAKTIAKWAMDEEEDEEFVGFFKGVKKVEYAMFEANHHGDAEFPRELHDSFSRKGWSTLARFREDEQLAWVLVRMRRESIDKLIVVHLDDEELTLVRLGGRLDDVLRAALDYARSEVIEDDDWIDAEEPDAAVSGRETLAGRE